MNSRPFILGSLAYLLFAHSAMSDTLVDPMRPPNARAAASTNSEVLKLEAILVAGDKRTAIVNGKLVNAGDRLDDAVIDAITADSIRYTRRSRSYVATLTTPHPLGIRPAASQGASP